MTNEQIIDAIRRQKTCVIAEDTGIDVGDVIAHQDPITQETHSIMVAGVARNPIMGGCLRASVYYRL